MEESTAARILTVLADHDIEGQAMMIWQALDAAGLLEMAPLRLATFARVELAIESSDCEVWQFAQQHGMVLLTGNRHMDEADSLEQTIREQNTLDSLPVLTIGNTNRVVEREYRERCAVRLLEVMLDLRNYLGAARIYIP
jgi:hypothetical protein